MIPTHHPSSIHHPYDGTQPTTWEELYRTQSPDLSQKILENRTRDSTLYTPLDVKPILPPENRKQRRTRLSKERKMGRSPSRNT